MLPSTPTGCFKRATIMALQHDLLDIADLTDMIHQLGKNNVSLSVTHHSVMNELVDLAYERRYDSEGPGRDLHGELGKLRDRHSKLRREMSSSR